MQPDPPHLRIGKKVRLKLLENMSEITTDAAAATQQFMSKNLAARSKLKNGLAKEQEKQTELRAEFGEAADALFLEWRKEQETQQQQASSKLQEQQEQQIKTIESKQES